MSTIRCHKDRLVLTDWDGLSALAGGEIDEG